MTTVVIMPGGFHPFHAGHLALYQAAKSAFPRAEVFVAATNDTSARPFPFAVKEKLAQLAGVAPSHFVQVKSPFRAEEITARFDPKKDRLIFVRSEKDADKPPQPGGVKKDGSPSYLQPLAGATNIRPFSEHAYMAYLPTVEFGPGMTSATEIRTAWPQLNNQRKRALVMSLYPKTQRNARLADTVVRMLDTAIIAESINPMTANTAGSGAGMTATYQEKYNQPAMENQGWAATYNESDDYIEEKWSAKYKRSINCSNPRGFSQRAHCAGRKKNEDVAEGLQQTPFTDEELDAINQYLDDDLSFQGLRTYPGLIRKIASHFGIASMQGHSGEMSFYDRLAQARAEGDIPQQGVAEARSPEEFMRQMGKIVATPQTFEVGDWVTIDPNETSGYASSGMIGRIVELYDDEGESMAKIAVGGGSGVQTKMKTRGGTTIGLGKGVRSSGTHTAVPTSVLQKYDPQGVAEAQLAEKCWDTHRQAGMKKKGNRRVPNCVPK